MVTVEKRIFACKVLFTETPSVQLASMVMRGRGRKKPNPMPFGLLVIVAISSMAIVSISPVVCFPLKINPPSMVIAQERLVAGAYPLLLMKTVSPFPSSTMMSNSGIAGVMRNARNPSSVL